MYNEKRTESFSGKKAAKGFYGRSKYTALVLALSLLLGIGVGWTIAYLVRETDPVVNEFVHANVEINIDEQITNNIKEKVIVENKSSIPVYIRVAFVGNWADKDGKICINHNSTQPTFTLGEGWAKGTDGFYYYTKIVAVGGKTTDLLGSGIALELAEDECSYQLEVIASAIQAQGDNDTESAVCDAWKIDPTSLKQGGESE